MQGFFAKSLPVTRGTFRTPRCGACGLYRKCQSPKMPVAGRGLRKILVVGESPGEVEDSQGKPFVGPAGQRLQQGLRKAGVDLFRDCWVTNAARCRPPKNEMPPKAVEFCRPYLIQAVEELKPETIILLGGEAVESLIGYLWREDAGGVMRWAGFKIPCQRFNCWIAPTFHPSFVLRKEDPVADLIFDRHLKEACELNLATAKDGNRRPWGEAPDWKSNCRVELDDAKAAKELYLIRTEESCVSFDFETTCLKPDGPHAEVVCCSVSTEDRSIAFPWRGRSVEVTREIISDPQISKIGFNLKFEDRWSRRKLGVRVRGAVWDGMLAAHALDSRPGITSLKFQAFALLGQEDWSGHVRPYLEADGGGNAPNRVRQVDVEELCIYCGLDSLLEYKVAEVQAKMLGVEL